MYRLKTLAALTLATMLELFPVPVKASGQLPPMPLEDRDLPNFAACRAFLEQTWQTDRTKADPKPIPTKDGSRQTLIDSKGVVQVDAHRATYEVEEGWQFRRPAPALHQIRIDYSYDRRAYQCDGRRLTGTSTSGYALEGYEPIPEEHAR